MNVPGTMTTPRMKLADGEELVVSQQGLRKKGLFGNRFGELHVTNQRVAFVKAIMKAGLISAAANKKGAKPIVSFDRSAITSAEKVQHKKLTLLVIGDGTRSERFAMDPAAIDDLIGQLSAT